MNKIILFLIVIQFAFSVISQNNGEKIINAVLKDSVFIRHLLIQEIMDLEQVNYLLPNRHTDTSWQIVFQNKQVDFNNELGKTTIGFENGYDLEVLLIKIKRKKADITLRFFPSWKPCSDNNFSYIQQTQVLFLDLTAKLEYVNSEWEISLINISDESFENEKEKFPCIVNNYKRINK